jgi:3-oxoacyl-[acyl-carrier protein] reductase
MKKYDSIKVGQRAELTHTITKSDISQFVHLTGDDNRLHLDEEFSSKTEMRKPVAHGMISASFISTIIGTKIPGDGALWYSQSIEFLAPVRVGDTIHVMSVVTNKIDRTNSIELQTEIFNQDKVKVLTGLSKVKVIELVEEKKTDDLVEVQSAKVALIIGASGGIGYATARRLAISGYRMALHYHSNKSKITDLLSVLHDENIDALGFRADLNNSNEIKTLIDDVINRFGKIDVLVNCSTPKLPSISIEEVDYDEFEKHLDLNIKSNFLLVKSLIPHFKTNKGGRIILLSTQATENVPPQGWSFYVTAKYALNGFMRSMAIELAKYSVNVNAVSPGMTETELVSTIPEKAKMLLMAKIPLSRLASPEDVAGAIDYLSSDSAKYMTGETIRINGGQSMN